MKRRRDYQGESDDNLDDLPLKYISSNYKVLSIKKLKMYSVHACEFCEAIFDNTYDYLIHNAKHIIIPLIKILPQQCSECGFRCISEDERNKHIADKHIVIKTKCSKKSEVKVTDRFAFENDVKEELSEDDMPLHFMKKEEDIVQNTKVKNVLQNFMLNCKVDVQKFEPQEDENVVEYAKMNNDLQSFMKNCKVDVEKFEPPWLSKPNDDIKRIALMGNCESDCITHEEEYKPSVVENCVKESEEASLENKIDFNSLIHSNVVKKEADVFKPPEDDSSSDFSDYVEDPIVILGPVKKEVETENIYNNCIHFDDLMKPGIFYCKRCFKRYPNRFEVIVHEAVHLDLSKAAPENYKRHKPQINIPLPSQTCQRVKTCPRCEEKVSDDKMHAKICFTMYCSKCAKSFNNNTNLTNHEKNCNCEAAVNICDTCLYLRKKPKHIHYYGIMRYDNSEGERICHWCGQKTDLVSLVTMVTKQTLKDKISFEGEERDGVRKNMEKKERKVVKQKIKPRKRGPGCAKPKYLSNRERLKLIQHRLKSMKK